MECHFSQGGRVLGKTDFCFGVKHYAFMQKYVIHRCERLLNNAMLMLLMSLWS